MADGDAEVTSMVTTSGILWTKQIFRSSTPNALPKGTTACMGVFPWSDFFFLWLLKSTVLPNSLWENKHSLRRVGASQLSDVHLFPSFVLLFTPAILSLICCLFVSSSPLQFFLFRSLYNLPCLSTLISFFLVHPITKDRVSCMFSSRRTLRLTALLVGRCVHHGPPGGARRVPPPGRAAAPPETQRLQVSLRPRRRLPC